MPRYLYQIFNACQTSRKLDPELAHLISWLSEYPSAFNSVTQKKKGKKECAYTSN